MVTMLPLIMTGGVIVGGAAALALALGVVAGGASALALELVVKLKLAHDELDDADDPEDPMYSCTGPGAWMSFSSVCVLASVEGHRMTMMFSV